MKLSGFKCCLLLSLLTHMLLVAEFKYFNREVMAVPLPAATDSNAAVLVVTSGQEDFLTLPPTPAISLSPPDQEALPKPLKVAPEKITPPATALVESAVADSQVHASHTENAKSPREPVSISRADSVAVARPPVHFISKEPTIAANISVSESPVSVKVEPKYFLNPKPKYPAFARQHHQEGIVWLRVQVTAAGGPAKVELKKSSGFPALDEAAIQAVRVWEFTPARVGSLAVASDIELPIEFKLR